MILLPRFLQIWISAAIIGLTLVAGTVQAALTGHVAGAFAAIALGAAITPTIVRAARRGGTSTPATWLVTTGSMAIPVLATWQLRAADATYLSISWYTCGLLAGAMLMWTAGRRAPVVACTAWLVGQTLWWAGPAGLIRLGVAAEVILFVALLLIHRTIRRVIEAATLAAEQERRLTEWQAEHDAIRLERRHRLLSAGRSALPLLHRIVDSGCRLDAATEQECRVLEQTIRDEIRGRRLLNDAVRAVVLEHRRRGAAVQMLDDGGLDGLAKGAIDPLLEDLAARLRPLRSTRIVVRTAGSDSPTAITVVATSPASPEELAQYGDDDHVDLWAAISRPMQAAVAAAPPTSTPDRAVEREAALALRT